VDKSLIIMNLSEMMQGEHFDGGIKNAAFPYPVGQKVEHAIKDLKVNRGRRIVQISDNQSEALIC